MIIDNCATLSDRKNNDFLKSKYDLSEITLKKALASFEQLSPTSVFASLNI